MKFMQIQIHGKERVYVVKEGRWYFSEYNAKKKKYQLIETVVEDRRKKESKQISEEELVAKVNR